MLIAGVRDCENGEVLECGSAGLLDEEIAGVWE